MINHCKRAAAFICALSLAATTACGAVDDEKDSKKSVPAATTVSTQSAAETITSSTTAETTSATTTTTTVAETTTIQTEPPADDGIKPYTEIDPIKTNNAYASAVTKYTAELYKQTAYCNSYKGKGALCGRNDLVSGYSAMLAFGMAANGAAGNTRSQMLSALGDIDFDTLNSETSGFIKENSSYFLDGEEHLALNIANSIWLNKQQSDDVKQSYLDICSNSFMSEVRREEFDNDTLDVINGWVNDKTNGMIPEVLNDIDPAQKMILINCLCFEDTWQQQFEDHQIEDGVFHAANGTEQNATMLKGKANGYFSNEFCEGFIKPYSNWRFYFAAMLPREGVSIEQAVNGLSEQSISDFIYRPNYDVLVDFKMPEFTYDYDTSLVDEMKNLGCVEAFDSLNGGDFSEMTDLSGQSGVMYISDALQKTHIELDRHGTKAAAATAMAMTGGGPGAEIIKELNLDRPFLYMIVYRGDEGDFPIFIGTVNEL